MTVKASVSQRSAGCLALCCMMLLLITAGVCAAPEENTASAEPIVYLNMNEATGPYAIDFSGNGNSGQIYCATRVRAGACGQALFFNGVNSYVAIPYRTINHPEKAITVDLWFVVDSFDRQVLVSSYNGGGYRLAFDDGNDLWWTVNTKKGDVCVPIQHENIVLHRWHHVAGTYDGTVSKIYLDGVLRSVVNGTGPIVYSQPNDVMLGVDAGTGSVPDPQCNGYLKGGLDEVRIYEYALTYGQVMDNRFSCEEEPRVPEASFFTFTNRTLPSECSGLSPSFSLSWGESATQRIIVSQENETAVFSVKVPKGATLFVGISDAYDPVYSDSWYFELEENGKRLTRSIAFPNLRNTPVNSVIPSGNATVRIRYFDGTYRFPSSAFVNLRVSEPPVRPTPTVAPPIVLNPIIVIYTASWATLIALALVVFWLHRRHKKKNGNP